MSDSIKIKSTKVLTGLMLVPFHANMTHLANWVVTRLSEVVFTSSYRPQKIHAKASGIAATNPCRHLDIRSSIYGDPEGIVKDINGHWTYDPQRSRLKCALYHARCPKCKQDHKRIFKQYCKKCGTDITYHWHIHLQVHNNTEYLGG